MRSGITTSVLLTLLALLTASTANSQSRHSDRGTATVEGTVLSVTASREDGKGDPIKLEQLFLYENGQEQKIKNFTFDPSPSRILILVDNSQTLPTSVEALKKAAMEFAYEIYDGDQLFIAAYDEKPEIIQEWTDDAKKIEASLTTFRKKGNPYLFDAVDISFKEILLPLMPGTRKTALVVISDGVDRGSKVNFDSVLAEMQNYNVTVYSLQIADRTGGAYRRDQPKATAVITRLAEESGGKVFAFDEAQNAAKSICDELRKDRYLLSYVSANTSSYDARRLFLTSDPGIVLRTKAAQPPTVK